MGRPKKDAKILNIKLDTSIYNRLESYCNDLGQTKTTAVERILKQHFDEYDKGRKQIAKKVQN